MGDGLQAISKFWIAREYYLQPSRITGTRQFSAEFDRLRLGGRINHQELTGELIVHNDLTETETITISDTESNRRVHGTAFFLASLSRKIVASA